MKNRGPGPHVAWAGVVVRLDDGTVHAVEFTEGFITADLKLPGVHLHGRAASVCCPWCVRANSDNSREYKRNRRRKLLALES